MTASPTQLSLAARAALGALVTLSVVLTGCTGSGDSAHPTATLKLDTTLTGNGGSPSTTVKGQLTFTCS